MSFSVPRNFRERLKGGQVLIGGWQTLAQPAITEVMVLSGVDWILVDMEHSVMDFGDVAEAMRVADLMGCTTLVRPPDHDPATIKRLLDSKAHGIMAANVKSAEEAKRLVEAIHYAPKGVRGVGLGRAQGYGTAFDEQFDWAREGPILIVQIEDVKAVDELSEIFAVPGIDAFFVGPYDLSCSLGIPGEFSHPLFVETMEKIRLAGEEAGIPSGVHQVEPDPDKLMEQIEKGYRFIAYGVDFRVLYRGMNDGLNDARAVLKDRLRG